MRLRLFLAVGLATSLAVPVLGASITDGAVTLTYPASHWGATPVADLIGTEAVPAADVLNEMGWWYRVEGDTREYPLPTPDSQTYYPDGRLVAVWNNLDGKDFRVQETTYVWDQEGPSGAVTSSLQVTNNGAPRTFAAFHLVDPSVNGTTMGDSVVAVTSRYLKFTDGSSVVRYSSPYAQHFMVRPSPAIRVLLNDAAVTDLDDSGAPAGPGDLSAAFQWQLSVPTGAGLILELQLSSRLPSDHVAGSYLGVTPQAGLLFRYASGGSSWVLRGFRHTSYLSPFSYGAGVDVGYEFAALDDLDGDQQDDSVGHNPLTGETRVNFAPVTGAAALPPEWKISATGDFNADGKADLLWRNGATQKLLVWLMNGRNVIGTVVPNPDQAVHANWAVVGAADFNADGFNDVLWYNQTSGNIVIWYMDGALQRITGGFTAPSSVGANNWRAAAVGDFGKGAGAGALWNTPDIVWQNDTSSRLVVWHMNSAGARTSGTFTTPDLLSTNEVLVGPR